MSNLITEQTECIALAAAVEVLEEARRSIAFDYIIKNNIRNQNGFVPDDACMIEDETVFKRLLDDIEPDVKALGIENVQQLLKEAEDALLWLSLEGMPHCHERTVLQGFYFGEKCRDDVRRKALDIALKTQF